MSMLTPVTRSMLLSHPRGHSRPVALHRAARSGAGLCLTLLMTSLCLWLLPSEGAWAQPDAEELELEGGLEAPAQETPAQGATSPETAGPQGQSAPKPQGQSAPKPQGQSAPKSPSKPAQNEAGSSNAKVKVERLPAQVAAQPTRGEDIYKQQIAQIEAQVNELKEEVFRSRTRLDILKETVLAIGLSGSEVKIIHRNEMGANFKLESVYYMIDDTAYSINKRTLPDFDTREEIVIYDGPLSSENHTIQVELVYRGNGFGVFSYLKSYLFTLNEAYTFKAEEGKRTIIKGIGYEKGGTLEFTERPSLRFDQSEVDLEQKNSARGK